MNLRGMLLAAAFAGLMGGSLSADTISGSFNIAGTIIATQNTIDWQSNDSPFPVEKATIGPNATGSFAALSGTTVTIEDLNRSTEPVGSFFGPDLFISFDAAPSMPDLNINMIYDGIYGTAQCTAAPAVGQQCTPGPPITPSESPFNFVNNPPPVGEATATFVFSGGVNGTSSTWNGNFTSQFSVPYQTVLSDFASNGSVTNTYSATIDVSSPAPEGSTLSMLGLGLGLVLLSRSGLLTRLGRQG